jgi:hypothetical protein
MQAAYATQASPVYLIIYVLLLIRESNKIRKQVSFLIETESEFGVWSAK